MTLGWTGPRAPRLSSDALDDIGFDEFSVDDHARNILFGCKANAYWVCDRAPFTVRAKLQKQMQRYRIEEAERFRSFFIENRPYHEYRS